MNPPVVVLTGGTGLLGGELLAALAGAGAEAPVALPPAAVLATRLSGEPAAAPAGVRWRRLDLREPGAASALIERERPRVVVHTAMATGPADARRVIVEGSAEVAAAAHAAGAALVHLSSDMVFDGEHGPFAEDAPLSPITDYGRAKAAAEQRVRAAHPGARIVRASLLYRLDPPDRSTAHWLAGLERGRPHPLFTDEIRCPAHVADVARALARLVGELAAGADGLPPVLHLVGPRPISRHALGRLVLAALGRDPDLAPAGRSRDSGLARPRDLTVIARATPRRLTDPLRAPADALPPAGRRD